MKDDMTLRLEAIEKSIRRFDEFLDQYHANIPLKYRKGFPKKGENPLITHKKFLPLYPKVYNLEDYSRANEHQEIQLPDDPREYQKAKDRMEGCKIKADIFATRPCDKCKEKIPSLGFYKEIDGFMLCSNCCDEWVTFKQENSIEWLKRFCSDTPSK